MPVRDPTVLSGLLSPCSVADSLADQLLIYSYSRCSTCRKAITWLQQKSLPHQVIDIVDHPPTREQLADAFEQLGERKLLFNTSGLSYRALGAAAVKAMTDDAALDALAADGKLIKRPFVITPTNKILVGFKPEVWTDQLVD